MSEHVTLRPVQEDDLPVIEALIGDPDAAGEFSWSGWNDPGRERRGWAENQLLGSDGGMLTVVLGDQSLGFVNWRRARPWPTSFSWEIGIALRPEVRGRGDGTQRSFQLGYLTSALRSLPRRRQAARGEGGRPLGKERGDDVAPVP